jgi:hypothetical protein
MGHNQDTTRLLHYAGSESHGGIHMRTLYHIRIIIDRKLISTNQTSRSLNFLVAQTECVEMSGGRSPHRRVLEVGDEMEEQSPKC